MRVPLSWLREYVDPGLDVEALAEALTVGGLAVEAVDRPTGGTRGVVVAEVRAVEKIGGSDRLYLVEAFDGRDTHTIVCGAANYAPGDRVAAALPGATLPGPDAAHPRKIGRKKLFGHVSDGMLASARELGVGEDHAGIWVLDDDAPVGADLAEWLDLDDAVLDLEVTPDRGYALSIIGVARDVAALTGAELRLPEATPLAPQVAVGGRRLSLPAGADVVPVAIADPDRCPRFDARTIREVRVGRSPAWLQRRLVAAGMRPVSNVVDATNHAMLETGNPVHAYDLALLAGPRIEVRTALPGETLSTLDGIERRLDADDLLICDASGPVALAGVMGGEATEINDATGAVLLEVANFAAASILRTSRRHGLRTEGSVRWERIVPPETVPLAAARCAALITALAGGGVTGAADEYPNPPQPAVLRLRPAHARSLLGMDLGDERQAELLGRIGCAVTPGDGDLVVTPPAYRPDLRLEADLAEELARLEGYDRVPERVPSTGAAGGRSPEQEALRAVRRALAGAGWTEVMPFPFIAEDDLAALGLPDGDPRRRAIPLVNPLSKEEAVLRTTLVPGLLRIVRHNVNRRSTDVALFESGHVFLPPTAEEPGVDGGPPSHPTYPTLPAEPAMLGFAAAGDFLPARHDRPGRPADVYDLLGAADVVLRTLGRGVLGRGRCAVEAVAEPPYHQGRAARIVLDGVAVGTVGELHPRVQAAYELPPRTLAGELRLDRLVAGGIRAARPVVPSALPGLRFDVAAVVPEDVPAAAVEDAVRAAAGPGLTECGLFDVYRGPQLGEGRKSLAYTLSVDDPQRQLTDVDEHRLIEAIDAAVAQRLGGQLRR